MNPIDAKSSNEITSSPSFPANDSSSINQGTQERQVIDEIHTASTPNSALRKIVATPDSQWQEAKWRHPQYKGNQQKAENFVTQAMRVVNQYKNSLGLAESKKNEHTFEPGPVPQPASVVFRSYQGMEHPSPIPEEDTVLFRDIQTQINSFAIRKGALAQNGETTTNENDLLTLDKLQNDLQDNRELFRNHLLNPSYFSETLRVLYVLAAIDEGNEYGFKAFALSFTATNSHILENRVKEKLSTNDRAIIVSLGNHLSKDTEKTYRSIGTRLVAKGFDVDLLSGYEADSSNAARTIFEHGSDEQVRTLQQQLLSVLNSDDPRILCTLLSNVLGLKDTINGKREYDTLRIEHPLYVKHVQELIRPILTRYNLNPAIIKLLWRNNAKPEDVARYSIENITRIMYLEHERPGIAKFLYDHYGIAIFARYPEKMLIRQYDTHDDKTHPYGIALYTRDDHNGAFYHGALALAPLHLVLKKYGYDFRIAECSQTKDMVTFVNRFRHKYGKIAFAMLAGHGADDGKKIHFGHKYSKEERETHGNRRNPFLILNEFKRGLTSRGNLPRLSAKPTPLQLAFVDNPTIIFYSCSTGKSDGIAQEVSSLGPEIETIAPSTPCNIASISAIKSMKDNRLYFGVGYTDTKENVQTIYYKGGKQLNNFSRQAA